VNQKVQSPENLKATGSKIEVVENICVNGGKSKIISMNRRFLKYLMVYSWTVLSVRANHEIICRGQLSGKLFLSKPGDDARGI
jgi:hypothetical protein